jgi:hypothetical protein
LLSFGVDCKHLSDNRAIIEFVKKTKSSNPLLRKNISVLIETSPCEGELCRKENFHKRHKKKEIIHVARFGEKKRLKFVKGENAPQCFVKLEEKEYKCDSCEQHINYNCRSYVSTDGSTRFTGTNIDSKDMDLLTDERHQSTCLELPKAPGYIKIVTSTNPSNSGYDKIETYYEKNRKIPILVNFFANGRLFKVYRFFISYYFLIDGEWYATYIRVRSTLGKEKHFEFETIVRVLKGSNGEFHLFVDPENDPLVNRGRRDDLFRTN